MCSTRLWWRCGPRTTCLQGSRSPAYWLPLSPRGGLVTDALGWLARRLSHLLKASLSSLAKYSAPAAPSPASCFPPCSAACLPSWSRGESGEGGEGGGARGLPAVTGTLTRLSPPSGAATRPVRQWLARAAAPGGTSVSSGGTDRGTEEGTDRGKEARRERLSYRGCFLQREDGRFLDSWQMPTSPHPVH